MISVQTLNKRTKRKPATAAQDVTDGSRKVQAVWPRTWHVDHLIGEMAARRCTYLYLAAIGLHEETTKIGITSDPDARESTLAVTFCGAVSMKWRRFLGWGARAAEQHFLKQMGDYRLPSGVAGNTERLALPPAVVRSYVEDVIGDLGAPECPREWWGLGEIGEVTWSLPILEATLRWKDRPPFSAWASNQVGARA